jgi:hypothetical protein
MLDSGMGGVESDGLPALALNILQKISAARANWDGIVFLPYVAADNHKKIDPLLPLALALLLRPEEVDRIAESGFPSANTNSLLKHLPVVTRPGEWPEWCMRLTNIPKRYARPSASGELPTLTRDGRKAAIRFVRKVAAQTTKYLDQLRPSRFATPATSAGDQAPACA